jgi:hypothetical protein
MSEQNIFLTQDELNHLYKLMDHLGINDCAIACILNITRQYVSYMFANKKMSARMYDAYITLINFLQKVVDKNPTISFRRMAYESTDAFRERYKTQITAVKQAFINYSANKN